jgi:hypothetical protein
MSQRLGWILWVLVVLSTAAILAVGLRSENPVARCACWP